MSTSSPSPRRLPLPWAPIAVACLCIVTFTACAAAGVHAIASTGLVALNVLRKAFIGVTASNYGDVYKEDADRLFGVLAQQPTPAPGAAPPGTPPGTPPAPGAPGIPPPLPTPGAPGAPVAAAPGAPGAPVPGVPGMPVAAALSLEVGLYKEEIVDGRSMPVPVEDGETLYDRFGDHGDGDNIKFMFRTNADAYVYLISIDGTGWIQPIFPSSYAGFTNPVKANQSYLFPEGSTWAPLDSYRGIEHLYFVASRVPRPELERSLVAFASRQRELDPSRTGPGEDTQLAQVTIEAPLARGFDAPRQSVVTDVPTSAGDKFPVDAQVFAASGPDDIVVTRWFRHQ